MALDRWPHLAQLRQPAVHHNESRRTRGARGDSPPPTPLGIALSFGCPAAAISGVGRLRRHGGGHSSNARWTAAASTAGRPASAAGRPVLGRGFLRGFLRQDADSRRPDAGAQAAVEVQGPGAPHGLAPPPRRVATDRHEITGGTPAGSGAPARPCRKAWRHRPPRSPPGQLRRPLGGTADPIHGSASPLSGSADPLCGSHKVGEGRPRRRRAARCGAG